MDVYESVKPHTTNTKEPLLIQCMGESASLSAFNCPFSCDATNARLLFSTALGAHMAAFSNHFSLFLLAFAGHICVPLVLLKSS
jgi:hypothetical protein